MSGTDHAARIAEARERIRIALLAGESTAPHRVALHAAETEAARAADAVRKVAAEHEREQAAAIASAAEVMVSEADARLRARLDALAPPPSPAL
jgi:hypothetical protein